MAFDILSLVIGLVVGGVVVGILVEVMGRGREPARQEHKLTTAWRLAEMQAPIIVARDLSGVDVPKGAKVFASGTVDPAVLGRCEVRMVPPVRAEFALDGQKAVLFLAGVQEGALALVTVDQELIGRLRTEARLLSDRGDAYVERRRIRDLRGREGVTVETEGVVDDVLPFRDRFMIRLAEGEDKIAVLVDKDAKELRDERILVRGRLERDGGYPRIEATDIRIVG